MSSMTGNKLKISVFGQSHSRAIGVVIDGLCAGEKINMEEVRRFMQRRAPGQNSYATRRQEADEPEILSGLVDDVTCGAPLCAIIHNRDARPADYAALRYIPRPSHADYAAFVKYGGYQDMSGGGHFSGRLTAPLCFAGAVCMQLLGRKGISIKAHILRIKDVCDAPFELTAIPQADIAAKPFPVLDDAAGESMSALIARTGASGDSVGGVIQCAITGVPSGRGAPMFGGIENRLSGNMFAIPAVKGIEFGNGFEAAGLLGSQNNDLFIMQDGAVRTATNNSGGINGGISNGMPIVFNVAIKPTPSIYKAQDSVNLMTGEPVKLRIQGRHDPCIVPRAVPAVEAVAAFTMLDIIM